VWTLELCRFEAVRRRGSKKRDGARVYLEEGFSSLFIDRCKSVNMTQHSPPLDYIKDSISCRKQKKTDKVSVRIFKNVRILKNKKYKKCVVSF